MWISRIACLLNLSPLKTVVSRKFDISLSEISAVNLIVGWWLFARTINSSPFCQHSAARVCHRCTFSTQVVEEWRTLLFDWAHGVMLSPISVFFDLDLSDFAPRNLSLLRSTWRYWNLVSAPMNFSLASFFMECSSVLNSSSGVMFAFATECKSLGYVPFSVRAWSLTIGFLTAQFFSWAWKSRRWRTGRVPCWHFTN